MPATNARELGRAIVDYLTRVYPPANSTLQLIPPQRDQLDSPLTQALRVDLAQSGFAIAESPVKGGSVVHRLSYRVTTANGVIALRFEVDETEVTRIYSIDEAGVLFPASAFAVRK